jgi:hypothetical protein
MTMPNSAATLGFANAIELDGGQLNFLSIPIIDTFIETDHQPIGHFALSVPNLDALYERAQQLGLTIVSPPAQNARRCGRLLPRLAYNIKQFRPCARRGG